jgi:hypothetical protein
MSDQLRRLREPLLHLHKTLMDFERSNYERVNGKVTPPQLLNLLLQDQQFAWLHVISELVVRIDELLDSKEPIKEEDAESIVREARKLLTPVEISEDFGRKYQYALQQDPNVVMAHQEVRESLKLLQ